MDKIINSHIDKLEDIEAQIEKIIDQEISQIDIKGIISNPQQELMIVVNNIREVFLDKYAHDAIELGINFGKLIQKKIDQDKTIKVDDSNNPKLNNDKSNN